MDDRFGFVILNYRTMDETMDCVKSIDEHIREAHEIVIVDNASPDGSGEKLRQVYDGRGDIKVIINADNLEERVTNRMATQRVEQLLEKEEVQNQKIFNLKAQQGYTFEEVSSCKRVSALTITFPSFV